MAGQLPLELAADRLAADFLAPIDAGEKEAGCGGNQIGSVMVRVEEGCVGGARNETECGDDDDALGNYEGPARQLLAP